MPIGTFAKRAGLTPSALRFYDDAGLLQPELVDPSTAYRFYSEAQLVRALQLGQLREIGMSLPTIGRFFTSNSEEALRLIDDHVAKVATDAAEVQQTAATLKASLEAKARLLLCELPGPVLAAAVDQVLTTTVDDPEAPVLGGVRLEADPDTITLTATDRYRLATRTLVPGQPSDASWAGTLAGEDLRAATSRLRRSSTVILEAGERTLDLRLDNGSVAHCRLLTETFPDYRLMLRSLPPVTHRLTVETRQILTALEHQAPEKVGLRVAQSQTSLLLPENALDLNGTVSGPDLTIWFEMTTLYPAISHAIGGDVMLDLRGPDQPATIRSAIDGDLTTLAMPCREPSATTNPASP